jgi:hypothetical protein
MADITPTTAGYIRALMMILNHTTIQEDYDWAKEQLRMIDEIQRMERDEE